jgi:hypothetical protein
MKEIKNDRKDKHWSDNKQQPIKTYQQKNGRVTRSLKASKYWQRYCKL